MPINMELSPDERKLVERLRRLSPKGWTLAMGAMMALEAADAVAEDT